MVAQGLRVANDYLGGFGGQMITQRMWGISGRPGAPEGFPLRGVPASCGWLQSGPAPLAV